MFKINPFRFFIAVVGIVGLVVFLKHDFKSWDAQQKAEKEATLPEETYILTLSPNNPNAKELAEHFSFVAETFKLDSKVLVALAFQESSFKLDAVNNNDLGLFQINYYYQVLKKGKAYTIEEIRDNWKLNTILAAQYLRECAVFEKNKALNNFSCYHSFTSEKAMLYNSAVLKHLNKINGRTRK